MKKLAFLFMGAYAFGQASTCDVNSDGLINIVDVQLLVNQALGSTASTADLNRDGNCTVVDVQRVIRAVLAGSCGGTTPSGGEQFSLTSPADATGVSGQVPLGVAASALPGLAKVEYFVDGHSEATATAAPWNAVFHSTNGADSASEVYALARDVNGNVLATSRTHTVQIHNLGVDLSFVLPNGTLSGDVAWKVSSTQMSGAAIAYIVCSVDGRTSSDEIPDWLSGKTQNWASAPVTMTLHTARFPNGTHQLHCAQWVNGKNGVQNPYWDSTTPGPLASATKYVTFENGGAPMELRSKWQDVFLTPGQTISLAPYVQNCDNSSTAIDANSVTYSTADAATALVSSTGLVTGNHPGATTITLKYSGFTSNVRVTVTSAKQFKHLSKRGQILSAYDPSNSLFLRAPFQLDYGNVKSTPGLGEALGKSGVNAMTNGLHSLLPLPNITTYDAFYITNGPMAWSRYWADVKNTANQYGLGLFWTGDSWLREYSNAWRIMNTPWRQTAVSTVLSDMRDSGISIGIDMVDETDYVWGMFPKPPGTVNPAGPFTQIIVAGCPSVPCVGTASVHYQDWYVHSGEWIQIRGASHAGLNGPYTVQSVVNTPGRAKTITFTIRTRNLPNGIYNAATDPAMTIIKWQSDFDFCVYSQPWSLSFTSLSVSSGLATVPWTNHAVSNGQVVRVQGALNASLNDVYTAQVVDANTIQFSTDNVPDGTFNLSNNPGLILRVGCLPPLDNNFFIDFVGLLNRTAGRTPISWPVVGIADIRSFRNWEGDPSIAEYNSLYTAFVDGRRLYRYGESLYQSYVTLKTAAIDRKADRQLEAPGIQLVSVAGWNYRKMAQADRFQPGVDQIENYGVRPEGVSASLMFSAASGMAGVRVYGFDGWSQKQSRANSAIGSRGRQTFADPFVTQVDVWNSMSFAFNLIQTLEKYILQPNIQSPNLGPMIFTGAKEGSYGKLLIAINFSEMPQTVKVDFTPYSSGVPITRHRLTSTTSTNGGISPSAGETITLAPGETVAYTFATP